MRGVDAIVASGNDPAKGSAWEKKWMAWGAQRRKGDVMSREERRKGKMN
jgi:hypothetical protein